MAGVYNGCEYKLSELKLSKKKILLFFLGTNFAQKLRNFFFFFEERILIHQGQYG